MYQTRGMQEITNLWVHRVGVNFQEEAPTPMGVGVRQPIILQNFYGKILENEIIGRGGLVFLLDPSLIMVPILTHLILLYLIC